MHARGHARRAAAHARIEHAEVRVEQARGVDPGLAHAPPEPFVAEAAQHGVVDLYPPCVVCRCRGWSRTEFRGGEGG